MLNDELKGQLIKTGTTTIGIVCKDGIILAADKKATADYFVAHSKVDKIIPIEEYRCNHSRLSIRYTADLQADKGRAQAQEDKDKE